MRGATLGLLPSEVYAMTFRELNYYSEGVNKRRREDYRQGITLAHLTASLMRAKRMPRLNSLLPREPGPKLTREQRKTRVWDMVRALARPGEIKDT